MPNIFAYIVLYGWPVFAFFLFRYLPTTRALIWTIVLGYLFMPPANVAFDIPVLPAISKIELASLSALFMVLAFHGRKSIKIPKHWVMRVIIGAYVFVPVLSLLTNPDPIYYFAGPIVYEVPGHVFSEIPSFVLARAFNVIPFILAYSFLNSKEHLTEVLVALVTVATYHSVLLLFEIRFSPQLNIWIYGFFQHSFEQMVRGDGYRPIVFLYHALWLGFFMVLSIGASISLYRYSDKDGKVAFFSAPDRVFGFLVPKRPTNIYLMLALYFVALVVLSKSYGPIIYTIVVLSLLLTTGAKTQITIAMLIAVVVVTYPLSKLLALVPEEQIVAFFTALNHDRAGSLLFRLVNETILFERVLDRPLFGWGGYGRNLIFSGYGRILTVPDGGWIIELGRYGVVGWASQNGLMLAPIFLAFIKRNQIANGELSPHLAAIALLLALNGVDMLPNATLTILTFLISGAAWANLEGSPVSVATKTERRQQTSLHPSMVLSASPPPKKRTIL